MKLIVKPKDCKFTLRLYAPARFAAWIIRMASGPEYAWAADLLCNVKKMRRLMQGRPLVDVEADDVTLKVFL